LNNYNTGNIARNAEEHNQGKTEGGSPRSDDGWKTDDKGTHGKGQDKDRDRSQRNDGSLKNQDEARGITI
jgi:hypothetical protein